MNPAWAQQPLVLNHATVYVSPDASPLKDAVVVLRGDKIVDVGNARSVKVPRKGQIIDCSGMTITAGFQNSHVHFLEAKWLHADQTPGNVLATQLADMLTSYGFTTVVDTGSDLATTTQIRKRIESGEVPGPRIYTAGPPLFEHDAIPFYFQSFPEEILKGFHQLTTPDEAVQAVRENLAGGADITKLYTGSLMNPSDVKTMPEDIARAAANESHEHYKLVYAHPSNPQGVRIAVESGVDVLAHTTAGSGPWPSDLIAEIIQHHISITPTLTLWGYEMRKAHVDTAVAAHLTADAVGQVADFVKAGGNILFGTDVGYMSEYDPAEEYSLMARAGMSSMQILKSLTVEPAIRFGEEKKRGRIKRGMQADLTALEGDLVQDVRNFARVRYTIRNGKIIYPLDK